VVDDFIRGFVILNEAHHPPVILNEAQRSEGSGLQV
jgi:hypothetical protein